MLAVIELGNEYRLLKWLKWNKSWVVRSWQNDVTYNSYEKQEHLLACILNTQKSNGPLQVIFIGTASNVALQQTEKFLHYAIKHMATSLILFTTTSSGIIHPSKNDDGVTQQMRLRPAIV